MIPLISFRSFFLAIAFCSAPLSHAHSVWVEEAGGKLVARFGEKGEYEKSPGHLDQFGKPKAELPAGAKITKQTEGFLIVGADLAKPAVVSIPL